MAGTGLDEHHTFLHDLTIRTLELHRQGGGSMRGAASAICAHTAEFGPVCLHTGATRKLKLDRLGDFGGTNALFALLWKTRERRNIITTGRVAFLNPCSSLMLSDFCLYLRTETFEFHLPVFQK